MKIKFAALLLAFAPQISISGYIPESNLIFLNLGNNHGREIINILHVVLHQEKTLCWNSEFGFTTIDNAIGVSEKDIFKALIQKNKQSQTSLSRKLLSYHENGVAGFDGIIVYLEDPTPRMVSMQAKTLKVKTEDVDLPLDAHDVELDFCSVKPTVIRKP